MNGSRSDDSARRRRTPRQITPDYLERAALHYLERYASSAENLRRVLMRKVERAARAHDTDREAATGWIDALLARYRDAGLLDDRAYALGRARALHGRGGSRWSIGAKLRTKGVAAGDIDAALTALADEIDAGEAGSLELRAAVALARRRRLGPWRAATERESRREKDLAALARAGFDYDIARTVIEAESAEALLANMDSGQS